MTCACCGEDHIPFLHVDHVDGGGARHRKSVGDVYRWIIKNNFPNGFRTLCANCNWGIYRNKGVCSKHGPIKAKRAKKEKS